MFDDMPEEWRRVPRHPDYEVSSLGRVRSLKRKQPHIMRPFTDKLGYVRFHCDGKATSMHRAVAEAWHGRAQTVKKSTTSTMCGTTTAPGTSAM